MATASTTKRAFSIFDGEAIQTKSWNPSDPGFQVRLLGTWRVDANGKMGDGKQESRCMFVRVENAKCRENERYVAKLAAEKNPKRANPVPFTFDPARPDTLFVRPVYYKQTAELAAGLPGYPISPGDILELQCFLPDTSNGVDYTWPEGGELGTLHSLKVSAFRSRTDENKVERYKIRTTGFVTAAPTDYRWFFEYGRRRGLGPIDPYDELRYCVGRDENKALRVEPRPPVHPDEQIDASNPLVAGQFAELKAEVARRAAAANRAVHVITWPGETGLSEADLNADLAAPRGSVIRFASPVLPAHLAFKNRSYQGACRMGTRLDRRNMDVIIRLNLKMGWWLDPLPEEAVSGGCGVAWEHMRKTEISATAFASTGRAAAHAFGCVDPFLFADVFCVHLPRWTYTITMVAARESEERNPFRQSNPASAFVCCEIKQIFVDLPEMVRRFGFSVDWDWVDGKFVTSDDEAAREWKETIFNAAYLRHTPEALDKNGELGKVSDHPLHYRKPQEAPMVCISDMTTEMFSKMFVKSKLNSSADPSAWEFYVLANANPREDTPRTLEGLKDPTIYAPGVTPAWILYAIRKKTAAGPSAKRAKVEA